MTTFTIKRTSRLPTIRATLLDASGAAMNLTGASVVFRMRVFNGGAMKIVNQPATVVAPATSGVVDYAWGATDTDTEGYFEGEFEASIGGLPAIVPASGYVLVVIEPKVS